MDSARAARRPLAALAVVALLSAGCGSEPPGDGSGGSGGSTGAQDTGVRFSACVRAHGVPDFPDPTAEGDYEYGVSVTPAVFTKAVEACEDLKPPGALSTERSPEQEADGLRFAGCVREHGVRDFPDPVEGEPLINTYRIPSASTANGMTVLDAAIEACRSVSGLDR